MFYDLPNVNVGDTLWIPCSNFPKDLNDYITMEIESIFVKNNHIILLDSDGDENDISWLGKSMFLSYEEMKAHFSLKEEKEKLIDLLNIELKKHFQYVSLQAVVKIADYLIEKGVRIMGTGDKPIL